MKVKKYRIPIYGGRLVVIHTDDLKAVADKHKLSSGAEDCTAFVFNKVTDKGRFKVYAVFKRRDLDIIAHETVHAVNCIFVYRDLELDRINDEAQAYLTGWVFRKIYKALYNDSKGHTTGT